MSQRRKEVLGCGLSDEGCGLWLWVAVRAGRRHGGGCNRFLCESLSLAFFSAANCRGERKQPADLSWRFSYTHTHVGGLFVALATSNDTTALRRYRFIRLSIAGVKFPRLRFPFARLEIRISFFHVSVRYSANFSSLSPSRELFKPSTAALKFICFAK